MAQRVFHYGSCVYSMVNTIAYGDFNVESCLPRYYTCKVKAHTGKNHAHVRF